MNFDHIILTVLTFTPLAGAVLLALLPDRGKIMQWTALAITLLTFLMTLHLPLTSRPTPRQALTSSSRTSPGSIPPPSATISASTASPCG